MSEIEDSKVGEGWGDVDDSLKSDFIKWAEAPFKLQFHGTPIIRKNHWVGGRPSPCEGPGCADCKKYERGDENYRPKTTVLFEVKMLDEGEWIDRKFDMSMSAVRALKEIKDQLGEDAFKGQAISCNKTGAGAGTKYQFAPLGPAKALEGVDDSEESGEIPF